MKGESSPRHAVLDLVNLSFKLCVENMSSGKGNIQIYRKFIEIIRLFTFLFSLCIGDFMI